MHAIDLAGQSVKERQQRAIDKDDFVLGVVDDIGQLIGSQTDVQRMADRTSPGNTIIHLQMLIVVPGKGANAVTNPHP